jgi:hypothetical protein
MSLGLLANELRSNAHLHRIVVVDKGANLLASRWTYGQRIALVIHAAAQAQRAVDLFFVGDQAGSLRSSRSSLSQPALSRSPH